MFRLVEKARMRFNVLLILMTLSGVHADSGGDSSGMEFIFTFPYRPYTAKPQIFITTALTHLVTVTISVRGVGETPGETHTVTVTKEKSSNINLPEAASIRTKSSSKVANKAVVVNSTDPVSIYGFYTLSYSTDGFFVLPTTALGTDYVTVGYTPTFRWNEVHYSEFVVTAIEDPTVLSLTGPAFELSIKLHQYESYQFVADGKIDMTDVTGMSIKTDKPVSVMSGHQCAAVFVKYTGESSCDYLMENLPPVTTLGYRYILTPFLGRTSGFLYRVVSPSSGITMISVPSKSIALLQWNFYEERILASNKVITITSDKSILVSQYGFDARKSENFYGDSFMIVIPPTERFSHNVTFPLPEFGSDERFYVSIISECNFTGFFYLDDQPLMIPPDLQTDDTKFCVIRKSVSAGFHSVTHASVPFLVLVYGLRNACGYGYVAGYNTAKDAAPDQDNTANSTYADAGTGIATTEETGTGVLTTEIETEASTTAEQGTGIATTEETGSGVLTTEIETEVSTTAEQGDNLLGVSIGVPASLAVLIAGIGICFYKFKYRQNDEEQPSLLESNQEEQHFFDYMNLARAPAPLPRPVNPADITWNDLYFRKELGSGEYGTVWLAKTKLITKNGLVNEVAVKSSKEGAPASEKENLLREWNLMKKFKPHPNVVQLLGGCFEKDMCYVILEYMERGPLNELLNNCHQDYDHACGGACNHDHGNQQTLSKTQLMKFATQVADGMEFIASNKCVHRDLAARNVLVSEDFICKVSDFGLARDSEEYHGVSEMKLPIRWMAVETLASDVHTSKSDVWSFGVLFWEIITLGARPYPGMGTKEVVDKVKEGYRMPKPTHCLEDVYSIMISCWAANPSDRPSFHEISERIQGIIELKEDYLQLDGIDEGLFVDTEVNNEDEKV